MAWSMLADEAYGDTMSGMEEPQKGRVGYPLLWLIGIPLPIVLLLYLFFH
jgi:hypothetical protein